MKSLCQDWRRLVTIATELLKLPSLDPAQWPPRHILRPPPERQQWDETGNNGTGIGISLREHNRGHQFSFESASVMGKNENRRDKMGKIQSHFSRASFPRRLGSSGPESFSPNAIALTVGPAGFAIPGRL